MPRSALIKCEAMFPVTNKEGSMIRFAQTPDRVFKEILDDALGETLFLLSQMEEDQDFDLWEANFPSAARCFTAQRAAPVIKDLLDASNDESALYQVTDYHWLLLHDCLLNFCVVFNDTAKEEDRRIGGTKIQEVDFDWIVSFYFWDVDFLMPAEILDKMGHEVRTTIGRFSDEAFAIAHGMEPHPDEIRMEKEELPSPAEDRNGDFYHEDSVRYPDFRDGEEEKE